MCYITGEIKESCGGAIVKVEKKTDAPFAEGDVRRLQKDLLQRYKDTDKNKGALHILLRICKGQYKRLLATVIFCALQLSATLYVPIATAEIIDALTQQQPDSAKVIIFNLIVSAVLLAINYPLQRLYMTSRNKASRSIEAALRGAIVSKLQQLTIQYNKETESGRIQSKIMRDVEAVRALISQVITHGVHIVINLVAIVWVLVDKHDPYMIVFFVLCGPAAAFAAKIAKKSMREKHREFRICSEETTARVVDMIDLIPVTKAHALEEIQIEKMNHQLEKNAKIGFETDQAVNRFIISNWLVMQIFSVLCLALSAVLTFLGRMTVGAMSLYQSYFGKLVTNISTVTNLIPTITAGLEAVHSIGEILDSDDIEEDDGKKPMPELRGEYRFENVSFAYRDEPGMPILKGLDLHVRAGETIALVGESGAGKSTILNLVTGFDLCDGGQVLIDGEDIKNISLRDYRKHIAVVLQNNILFSGSIRDNITYGLTDVTDEHLNKIIDLACLRDVIDMMPNGLDTLIGEHGNRLSGGQRQRIAIARALIRNPQVILFDEATSALDTVSEKHIQQAVENLSAGKTTFIVAHRLSTVKNADKIAVIEDGRCVEYGTYDELVAKKGAFYHFRALQI